MSFPKDDSANGTVLSITVAISLFALSFGALTLVLTNTVHDAQENAGSDLNDRARNALRVLVETAGHPHDWYQRTDAELTHIGLLKYGSPGTLDSRKFHDLQNDRSGLDWYYDNFRPLLDLTDADFHIRTYPVFKVAPDGNVDGLNDYRLAYIGNYSGTTPSRGAANDLSHLENLNVSFENNLSWIAPTDRSPTGSDVFSDESHRRLAATLGPRLAGFRNATDGRATWTSVNSIYGNPEPYDAFWQVINVSEAGLTNIPTDTPRILTPMRTPDQGTTWYSAGHDNASLDYTIDRLVVTRVNLSNYPTASDLWFNFSHHARLPNSTGWPNDNARVSVYCETCSMQVLRNWYRAYRTYDNHGGDTAADYWANESVPLHVGRYAGETIQVAFEFHTWGMNDAWTWFIKNMTLDVRQADTTTRLYTNNLDYTVSDYDALILGDDLDQQALTNSSTQYVLRHGLHDWVRAGGDVVAFGSDKLEVDWMENALLPDGGAQANNGLYLQGSDLTHAVLTSPHKLHYRSYADPKAKSYTTSDTYTDVLVGQGANNPALFAVSNPNTAFNGTVVLTSWNLTNIGTKDSLKFLVNSLAFARYNVLYLDYGPSIPTTSTVASETRTLLVDTLDPNLQVMETQVILYSWRT